MAITDRRGATVSATESPSSSTPNADLAIKTAVRVASTGSNIDIQTFGLGSIDGVALAAGDRVLLKNQTDTRQNGIYNASTGVWAMSSDFQNNTQLANGLQVRVTSGALNAGTSWVMSATDPVVLGTSAISFGPFITANGLAQAAIAPFYDVINPSSGNAQGSGSPTRHQLVWSDANPIFWADILKLTSTDPSAIALITIGGTATAGDVVQLNFKWGSHNVGVSYTVQSGDTTTSIAAGLVAAIKASASLYNPVSATNTGGGGYANSVPIGYATNVANVIAFDFNAGIGLSMTKAVTGAATETVTLPATDPTPLPAALDNNPAIELGRNPGFAPATNSVLGVIQFGGSQSASPTQLTVQYGSISVQILSSTSGALSSRLCFITPDVNGNQNQGLYVGAGAYTVGVSDKGVNTINASQLWVASTELLQVASSELQLISGAGHGIGLLPVTGAGRVAASGVDVEWRIAGDVAKIQSLTFFDSAARWQIYKPASSTNLRFYDGTADRITIANGGQVTFSAVSTIASATGATLDDFKIAAATTTITGNTGSPITQLHKVAFYQPTLTDSSAVTVTDADTVYIDNAPAAGGSVTLTNAWALRVGSGNVKFPSLLLTGTLTAPTIAGGASASSTLTIESTTGAGTSDAIIFKTASQTQRMRISTGGSVLIGTQTTAFTGALLDVNYSANTPAAPQGGLSCIRISATGFPCFAGESFGNGNNSFFVMRAAGGTVGSPSAVSSAQTVGAIALYSHNGTSYIQNGQISMTTINAQTGTDASAYMAFFTTASGSASTQENMRLHGSGGLCVGNAAVATDPGAGGLKLSGGFASAAPTTKTANYSQALTDSSLIFNGSGSITLTLLSAATYPGLELLVKTIAAQTVVSATSNVVPLAGGAAGTAILAATAGKWALLKSDGTNWQIMASN